MAEHDIVVIGGSAGSFPPLTKLVALLPPDLAAAVFVVVHRAVSKAPNQSNFLPQMLRRTSHLPVDEPQARVAYQRGRIYISPPRSFLLLEDGHVRVDSAPEANPARFGITALFQSAARTCGTRVVAVLLSGKLYDGVAGLWDVRRHGGVTIVQDPAQAIESSMPRRAMEDLPVHECLPVPEIADTIVRLTKERGARKAQRRVLIVEDERVVALNLEHQLKNIGYSVVGSVASGEEALRVARIVSPDVVLMDVHLAGPMRGTEAGKALWTRLGIPVVYATAYSDERTLADAGAAMPYGFVVKPYRAAQIHAALQIALDRRDREQKEPRWSHRALHREAHAHGRPSRARERRRPVELLRQDTDEIES